MSMQSVRKLLGVCCLLAITSVALGEDKAEVGKKAPDFELKSSDGKTVKLSDYKDKVVVLEWFNKDCPYCKKATPKMKENQAKYEKQGVVWLAVDSTGDRKGEDNVKYAGEQGIKYPILLDGDGKVGHSYGATNTPHVFVINKGTVAYMGASDDQKGRDYVVEALDSVLAGKEVANAKTKPYGCSIKYKS